MAFDDADGQADILTLKLPVFLHANLDRVLHWLTDESLSRYMQDFVHVTCAYISMYDQGNVPEDLLEKLEKVVEVNALNIDVN